MSAVSSVVIYICEPVPHTASIEYVQKEKK